MRHRIGWCRSVAAESRDHIRMAGFKNAAHLRALPSPLRGETQCRHIRASGKGNLLYRIELITRSRHQIALQTNRRADNAHLSLGLKPPDRLGDGKQRIDMPGGAATCENDMFHIDRA